MLSLIKRAIFKIQDIRGAKTVQRLQGLCTLLVNRHKERLAAGEAMLGVADLIRIKATATHLRSLRDRFGDKITVDMLKKVKWEMDPVDFLALFAAVQKDELCENEEMHQLELLLEVFDVHIVQT